MSDALDELITYADHTQGCMVGAGHADCTCGYDDAEAKAVAQRNRLTAALRGMVDLVEAWTTGPLFAAAGIKFPDGGCQAPALIQARAALAGTADVKSAGLPCAKCAELEAIIERWKVEELRQLQCQCKQPHPVMVGETQWCTACDKPTEWEAVYNTLRPDEQALFDRAAAPGVKP